MGDLLSAPVKFTAEWCAQCRSPVVICFDKRPAHYQRNDPCHRSYRQHHGEYEHSHQFAAKAHCLPASQTSGKFQLPSRPTDHSCTLALTAHTYRKWKSGITRRDCNNVSSTLYTFST